MVPNDGDLGINIKRCQKEDTLSKGCAGTQKNIAHQNDQDD